MNPRQILLEALKKLENEGPAAPDFGICSSLDFGSGLTFDENVEIQNCLEELFRLWPEFSGNIVYPIEGGSDRYHGTPTEAMWSQRHPYGAARLRLLSFLIETLETEMQA